MKKLNDMSITLQPKNIKKTNAQFAIEFVVLIAFMFLVFVAILTLITSQVLQSKESEKESIAQDIAELVVNEVDIAKSLADGYSKTFSLPDKINGNGYDIKIIDNRELVVKYLGVEHVSFLPEKVCGNVFEPLTEPDNRLDKENDVVCINLNLDYTQCENADCNILDSGEKCCCCERYNFCCT